MRGDDAGGNTPETSRSKTSNPALNGPGLLALSIILVEWNKRVLAFFMPCLFSILSLSHEA
jgi:hypothetical protein